MSSTCCRDIPTSTTRYRRCAAWFLSRLIPARIRTQRMKPMAMRIRRCIIAPRTEASHEIQQMRTTSQLRGNQLLLQGVNNELKPFQRQVPYENGASFRDLGDIHSATSSLDGKNH